MEKARGDLKAQLDQWLEQGVIEPSTRALKNGQQSQPNYILTEVNKTTSTKPKYSEKKGNIWDIHPDVNKDGIKMREALIQQANRSNTTNRKVHLIYYI